MTYAELMELSLDQVREFATMHPDHIGAQNALSEKERQVKQKETLKRLGKKSGKRCGMTKDRFSYRGPRVPTKRELQ